MKIFLLLGNGLIRIGQQNGKMEHTWARLGDIEWGIGELEWEAWMRQLDGAVRNSKF